MAQPGKMRFSIEATTAGTLMARAMDVTAPAVVAASLAELRAKVADLVRAQFPEMSGVALLVGWCPRRAGPVRAPRPDVAEADPASLPRVGVA